MVMTQFKLLSWPAMAEESHKMSVRIAGLKAKT
jgi:hypothetical protein